jgi:hypothetical protein
MIGGAVETVSGNLRTVSGTIKNDFGAYRKQFRVPGNIKPVAINRSSNRNF